MYLDNSTMSHLNAAEALAQLQNLPKLGTSSAPQEKPNRNRSTGLAIKFPEILMNMINDEQNSFAITWVGDGRSFAITNRKKLASIVLPRYFKQSKYTSFTRRLNRWGFTCFISGPDTCIYSHQLFNRDKPDLCEYMSASMNDKKRFNKKTLSQDAHTYIPHKPQLSSDLSLPRPRNMNTTITVPNRAIGFGTEHISLSLLKRKIQADALSRLLQRNIQASLSQKLQLQANTIPVVSPMLTNSIVGAALSALHRTDVLDMNMAYARVRAQAQADAGAILKKTYSLGFKRSPGRVQQRLQVQPTIRGAFAA